MRSVRSERLMEFSAVHFAVLQDFRQQASTYGFAAMYGDDRALPVRVLEKVVTALDADDTKTQALERSNGLLSGDGRKGAHD